MKHNKSIKLIDSHCHLDFPELESNLDEIIKLSYLNSVKKIITICTKLSELKKIIDISNRYENIWFTAGIHPHEASYENNSFNNDHLLQLVLKHDKCVGVGEAGLDFFYRKSSYDDQKKSFLMQIDVARKSNKPIVIHSRDADEEMEDILVSEYKKGHFSGVLHCFTGGDKLFSTALKLGFYISFSGIVTFKKSINLQSLASKVPNNKYLIETDSPYLSPEPLRGKTNNPSNVLYVAKFLAKLRNVSINTISNETWNNTCNLFNGIGD